MKKLLATVLLPLLLISCDPGDLQRILDTAGQAALTDIDISNGLKEALNVGVGQAVTTLSADQGYYKSAYKILLPEEARKVTDKLQFIPGFGNVEEEIIKRINQGAEDAASKATPIFVNAIKSLSFQDVTQILMGDNNAATTYLTRTTSQPLYQEFNPVVVNSLDKYNALDYWRQAVDKYNSLPFVQKVNPDLADYVTLEALEGLYALIAKKEMGIRTDINQRSSDLLKRVFAKQDGQ